MLAPPGNRDYAVGLRPPLRHLVPAHTLYHLVGREKQYTLGRCGHDFINQYYQPVDSSLLVNDIFDKRVHLAIGQRIEFDSIGVLAVLVRRLIFGKQGSVGSHPPAVPAQVEGEPVGRGIIGAFAAVESPDFDDAAQARLGRAEEIGISAGLAHGLGGKRTSAVNGCEEFSELLRALVQLPDKVDIPAPGVFEAVDEEAAHIHIVDPHAFGAETLLASHALHRRARYKELFEQPAVELGEFVAACEGALIQAVVCGTCAVTADYGLDKLTDKVVYHGPFAAIDQHVALGNDVAVTVAHEVGPLVAVGIALIPLAAFAQVSRRTPGSVGLSQYFFLHP